MASRTGIPQGDPPPYEAATSSAPRQNISYLDMSRNGIPPQYRSSMEDERRELPTGWVRQYDAQTYL
ncbi:hypothetical protein B0O99DRAFT_633407 [Bisporella sp. PMI_857]|nr:hypothetical protein B0O99DRAFT_633407 [Bisporella sp. PMI_857]